MLCMVDSSSESVYSSWGVSFMGQGIDTETHRIFAVVALRPRPESLPCDFELRVSVNNGPYDVATFAGSEFFEKDYGPVYPGDVFKVIVSCLKGGSLIGSVTLVYVMQECSLLVVPGATLVYPGEGNIQVGPAKLVTSRPVGNYNYKITLICPIKIDEGTSCLWVDIPNFGTRVIKRDYWDWWDLVWSQDVKRAFDLMLSFTSGLGVTQTYVIPYDTDFMIQKGVYYSVAGHTIAGGLPAIQNFEVV